MTHTDSSSQTRDARCKTLRQAIRHARRAIPEAEQHVAALKGCEQFLTLLDELSAQGRAIKTVALYFSCDGELDTAPLIEALWQRGITTCLPIIHPFAPGVYCFCAINSPVNCTSTALVSPSPGWISALWCLWLSWISSSRHWWPSTPRATAWAWAAASTTEHWPRRSKAPELCHCWQSVLPIPCSW